VKAAYDAIIAARATSSKNDKIAILTAQKSNKFLREFLRLCYEPRINFYLTKIDHSKGSDTFNPMPFDDVVLQL